MLKKALCLLTIIGLTSAVYAYNYDTNLPLTGSSIADSKSKSFTAFSSFISNDLINSCFCLSESLASLVILLLIPNVE